LKRRHVAEMKEKLSKVSSAETAGARKRYVLIIVRF
jgi:hypothetical protein